MKRRRFINRASLVTLAAILQACDITILRDGEPIIGQLPTSTPTPSGTPTRTPTFAPLEPATGTPTPTASATGTPTDTPTPTDTATPTTDPGVEPTETPTETPTPTPSPTPYPPGPPSKLGLFVTRHNTKVLEIVEQGRPALIKTLELDGDYVRSMKEMSPDTIIIGRIFMDQPNFNADPLVQARSFVDQLLPLATEPRRFQYIDAWESYNEPVVDTADKMMRLADFEAERARLLGERGLRSVVGNFATGNPPLELWPHFEPALAAARQYDGYLGLHEYSAPVMQFMSGALQPNGNPSEGDEGWLTLRYRKVYRNYLTPMGYGDMPCLITECGVDGYVQPRPGPAGAKGWQDFIDTWRANGLRDDPPGVYMDQLIWYDQNLQQDEYIKGAAIFLAGSNDEQWNTYDILGAEAGRMGDLLQQYLSVHPPQ